MKCTILNRNYPPSSGITGHSANELAEYLEKAGIEVHIVTVGGKYQGGGAMNLDVSGTVHTLKDIYNGKNKLLRLLSSLIEGWSMARKAVSLGNGPLVSMTDPPLLNFWVSRLALRKRIPWIYWSMDLYPEAFVASRLVSAKNMVYRFLKRRLLNAPPSLMIALGPNQAKFISQDYADPIDTVLLPCGITQTERASSVPDWANEDGRIVLGYIGNVGEAHDADFIKAVIGGLDADKYCFVLVAYGAKSESVLDFAKNREGVVVLDSVAREHLQFIDVHLVTLLPEWDHVCVPSKAVSAVCEGCGVFICCSELNDNWKLLSDAAWRIDVNASFPDVVGSFLEELTIDEVNLKRSKARSVSLELLKVKQEAFEEIAQAVKSLQHEV